MTFWNQKRLSWVATAKKYFEDEGLAPSVRQVYYILLVNGLVMLYEDKRKARGAYNKVDKTLLEARKQGLLSWDVISDGSRPTYRTTPSAYDNIVAFLEAKAGNYTRDVFKPQKLFILIFLEKDALSNQVWQATSRVTAQIPISVTRGYHSWGDFYKNVFKGYRVIYPPGSYNWKVFFLYDYDQDGEDAEHLVREQFRYFFTPEELQKVKFSRIAISPQQAEGLPKVTVRLVSPKQKIKFKRWIREHGAVQQSDGSLSIGYWELESMPPRQLVAITAKRLRNSIDMARIRLERAKEQKEKDRVDIDSDINYDEFKWTESEDELDEY